MGELVVVANHLELWGAGADARIDFAELDANIAIEAEQAQTLTDQSTTSTCGPPISTPKPTLPGSLPQPWRRPGHLAAPDVRQSSSMDPTTLATQERDEFADLLASLTDQQWEAPSLCENWRVRDVAAHVVAYLDRTRGKFTTTLAKHRFQLSRLNAADVASASTRPPQWIIDTMRHRATPRGVGSGFRGRIALAECMIHQQDVRRPLNLPRRIPAQRLRAALKFARVAPLIRGGWTTRGLRLIATDLDWSTGHGPEVRGPGEALLMAMARRPSALADLSGPGSIILSQRSLQTWPPTLDSG